MQRIFEYTQTHLMGIVLIKFIELNCCLKTKQNKTIRGHENLCFLFFIFSFVLCLFKIFSLIMYLYFLLWHLELHLLFLVFLG